MTFPPLLNMPRSQPTALLPAGGCFDRKPRIREIKMSAITGTNYSRYAGLLPIEPPEDFFRPIDLIPEDVPFPDGQPLARKRPRSPARFLIAFCTGAAAALLWLSHGDAAREMIVNSYRQLGWFAPRLALTAQNPHPPDVIGLAAPAAPS